MNISLRLTGLQHSWLLAHLFPGDGCEAVALALCGRHASANRHVLTVSKLMRVPFEQCKVRTPERVTWSTEGLPALLEEAARNGMSLLKIHSHPGNYERFSPTDDESDQSLFSSVFGWLDDEQPHASAVMLPDGKMFGRSVNASLAFAPLSLIAVAGDDLRFWYNETTQPAVPEFAQRHAQAFGNGTSNLLKRLSIAVIGCSGTGSPVIEQLARLGVGRLVLIDPDRVEVKNLNRILNTTLQDARSNKFKVDVIARAITQMGLGTEVLPLARNLFDPIAVRAAADCDLVFGCVDSIDGRHLLNRLATFYNLPYFDVGVKLEADGAGGVSQICGTVHYLQPDRSSLLSRGVFTLEQLRAAGLKRANPAAYQEQVKSKYIVGIQEDRPAVISVNMLFASLAVNEMLARLHNYRDDGNKGFAIHRLSLTQAQIYHEAENEPCSLLARHVGRGDVAPLLGMPELSERPILTQEAVA